MPLSESVIHDSYGNIITSHGFNSKESDLVAQINRIAAQLDIRLDGQSLKFNALLYKLVHAKKIESSNLSEAANEIFQKLNELLDKEGHIARQTHKAQGIFDTTPLDQRALRDQMQDHDVTRLMPKSSAGFEVLAPTNRFDSESTVLMCEGIQIALKDESIDHIVIPLGPGHWRGVYLTKPTPPDDKYRLELFDPYGGKNARIILPYVTEVLEQCGISLDKLDIEPTGPVIPQEDGYACGDFLCAYSHKKMKELGANDCDQEFIRVLDEVGNEGDALRSFSRAKISGIAHYEESSHVERDAPEVPLSKEVQYEHIEKDLDAKEKQVIDATIGNVVHPNINYKLELATIIKNRNELFKKVANFSEDDPSDEELAEKLQADELRNAGFKP